ncbi:MAG: hypothetical protein ACI3YM_00450 [Prevotella sp.]
MGRLCNPVLSEEQMAAYLDGMLSSEENEMVETAISSDPMMGELLEVIDDVDTEMITQADMEIPIDCLADDFVLPIFDDGLQIHSDEGYNENDEDYSDYQDNLTDDTFSSEDFSYTSQDDDPMDIIG